jgi:hypothetical protein
MRLLPLLVLTSASYLYGQAMVEYGAGAGRVGPAAAAAGKSVSKTIRQMDKALAVAATVDEQPRLAPAPAPVTPVIAAAPTATVPATPVDFNEIVAGMDKADLLKKAGKPRMSLTSTERSTLVETYWYRSGEDKVTVVLRNGKVATINGLETLAAK